MAKEIVVCTYRPRAAAEAEFTALLARHWPTLRRLEFVTDDKPIILRHNDEPTYVEIFTWVEGGFERAHVHPAVLAIWEPMEQLLESRDGRPKWEFPHFTPVSLEE
jgi:hypothetical protein